MEQRLPGTTDNPYYAWDPLPKRPVLRWPHGARVALCVLVHMEHVEDLPPAGTHIAPSTVGRGPYPELEDAHETSPHEYGPRVGIFRIMEGLERLGVPATMAIDAAAATEYPEVVERARKLGWELAGHGPSGSGIITAKMSEAEERSYIRRALEGVQKATGTRPKGWAGVEFGESQRTPTLLAEAGVEYVFDWPNDEQPYPLMVPQGRMLSLPVMIELDDLYTRRMRRLPPHRLSTLMIEAFDRLYADGAHTGRLLVLSVHPWITGQPFHIKGFLSALEHMARQPAVWSAPGGRIAQSYWQTRGAPGP